MADDKLPSEVEVLLLVRQARVEEMRLCGVPQHQIAVRLGVSPGTVSTDLRDIYERWKVQNTRLRESRLLAINALEYIIHEEILAWHRSKENAEEVATVYTPRSCPDCEDGMVGENKDQWCDSCQGAGTLLAEITTRRSKGQSGDSSHMRIVLEARKEISRLQGLGERKLGSIGKDAADAQKHLHTHVHAYLEGKVDWNAVAPELLLEAKVLIAKAVGLGQVIDVEANEVGDGR